MFPEDFLIENCHFKFLSVWMFECGSFIYFIIWLFFASCPRWFARAWVSMRNLLRSWEKSYPRRCAYRTRSFPKLAMSIKRKSVYGPPMTLMTLIFNDHYSLWIWTARLSCRECQWLHHRISIHRFTKRNTGWEVFVEPVGRSVRLDLRCLDGTGRQIGEWLLSLLHAMELSTSYKMQELIEYQQICCNKNNQSWPGWPG